MAIRPFIRGTFATTLPNLLGKRHNHLFGGARRWRAGLSHKACVSTSAISNSSSHPADSFSLDYTWHRSETDPHLWTRRGFGMEVLCDAMPRIDRFKVHGNICIGYDVRIRPSVLKRYSRTDLIQLVRSAWEATRMKIPGCGTTATSGEDGWTQLNYRSPQSQEELRRWSDETLVVTTGDLYQVRNQVGPTILPGKGGHQAYLYLTFDKPRHLGLFFHAYHTAFDLEGVFSVMSSVLGELGAEMDPAGPSSTSRVAFGQDIKALLPPCDDKLMEEGQFKNGRGIEESMLKISKSLAKIPRDPELGPENVGSYQTYKLRFTREESARILNAVKRLGFTVTHIFHAALILARVRQNPSGKFDPEGEDFVEYVNLNLRKFMKSTIPRPIAYPGICVMAQPIHVPISLCRTTDEEDPDILMRVARRVRAEYQRIQQSKAHEGLTSFCFEVERMISGQGLDRDDYVSKPFDARTSPPPQKVITSRFQALGSDGVGETLIAPHVFAKNGDILLDVEDFFISANQSENMPGFRLHSWNGAFHLTVNFNERVLDKAAMRVHLNQWAECIRLVVDAAEETSREQVGYSYGDGRILATL